MVPNMVLEKQIRDILLDEYIHYKQQHLVMRKRLFYKHYLDMKKVYIPNFYL